MTSEERLWLNGFTTVHDVLALDPLAIEEVRQVWEDAPASDQAWMAAWTEGFDAGVRASFGD